MSDNVLHPLQKLVQDGIAPGVRELKVRVKSLEKRMDSRFESIERQMEAKTRAILAAVSESRAQSELGTMAAVASLRERIAVLESKHN